MAKRTNQRATPGGRWHRSRFNRRASFPPRRTSRRRAPSQLFTIALSVFFLTLIFLRAFPNFSPEFPAGLELSEKSSLLPQYFAKCEGGYRVNCVVDGDTFWFGGEKIRIADIDTPETFTPRCDFEAEHGAAATQRLVSLLNEGAFVLQPVDRDRDIYGRSLRVVMRDGESVGGVLIDEGLARPYAGGRKPWC